MRRFVLAVIAVVLVNLPWANDAWVQHRIDADGVDVQATVVKDAQKHGDNYLSYRLPPEIDADQRLYGAQVSAQAYEAARATGTITARVVKGSPQDNRLEGQVTGSLVVVIAVVGDIIIALLLAVATWRRRRWRTFVVVKVDDDELTVRSGGDELVVQVAEDEETLRKVTAVVGAKFRGVLSLIPAEDLVEGPPLGEFTHVEGSTYRIAGRVRAMSTIHTDVLLENGYVLRVLSDEVEHEGEMRGPVATSGTLVLSSRQPAVT